MIEAKFSFSVHFSPISAYIPVREYFCFMKQASLLFFPFGNIIFKVWKFAKLKTSRL